MGDLELNPEQVQGGLPCAKGVIDQRNGVVRVMDCMCASIVLNAARVQPTDEHLERFTKAGEGLARVAAEIEKYVRG